MCGISVVVALHGTHFTKNEDIPSRLEASLDKIAHRGPDSHGVWISADQRFALGHCRLSINDLTPDGEQPLHSRDNNVHAVVNGEIYDDHDLLRHDLATDFGYEFKGHSDSELVVALYQVHGASFLSKLRGEFSLCLYDSEKDFFVAARDRYGIKPLFWTVLDDRLLISAEAKGFLTLGWQPEWDVRSIREAGWNHDSRTLFKGVQKVLPGHYFTLGSSSFGLPEIHQYWDMKYPDKNSVEHRTEDEMIAGVRDRLLEAVRLRLRADVPVGVYLSGGIDSSVLAGVVTHLVKEMGQKIGNKDAKSAIRCFSIAFDADSGFDESEIAHRTAEWLGVSYQKIHMNEAELAQRFEDATYYCEHHNPDLNFVGKYALSELPRDEGFKVVLTGEGADEIFAGYPLYIPDFLKEPDHAWPQSTLSEDTRQRLLIEKEAETKEVYTRIGADSSSRAPSHPLNNITTPASMTAFESPDPIFAPWTAHHTPKTPLQTIEATTAAPIRTLIQHAWHPLHAALYVWSKGHLPNIFLTCLGDRTEMAHSIEARPAFLDHHLAEYVNGLPPSVKLRWESTRGGLVEKWILREAGRPFVTREVYARAKHPYTAPTTWPAGGPLHRLFEGLLARESVEGLGFVEWDAVRGLVGRAFCGKDAAALRTVLVVGEWIVLARRFGVSKAVGPQ